MYQIFRLTQINFKVLLRKKSYLALIILLPLFSILLLNIDVSSSSSYEYTANSAIKEISDRNETVAYNSDYSSMTIKILDHSDSALTDLFLQRINGYGMFSIFRCKTKALTRKSIDKCADRSANNDDVGALIYLDENFEKELLSGNITSSVLIYDTCKDERYKLLTSTLEKELSMIQSCSQKANHDSTATQKLLKASIDSGVSAKVIETASQGTVLTNKQKVNSSNYGYSISIISLAFIFSSMIIASSIIDENQKNFLTRVLLTNTSSTQYLLAKFCVSVLTIFIQTAIMGLGIGLFVHTDFGISILTYMFLAFGLGFIFSIFCLAIGVLCKNSVTANYIGFVIWSCTCLLGGLYFTIEDSSSWYQNIARLMPQHWTLKCMELIMTNHSYAYGLYVIVILAFTLIIGTICTICIKLSKREI